MDATKLARLGGVAAILGGLVLVVFNSVEVLLFSGASLSALANRDGWVPFQAIGVYGSAVIVLGLTAIYFAQAERAGRLGLAGFVVSLAGAFGYAGASWAAAFVVPSLGRASPTVLDGPDPLIGVGLISTTLIAAIGWILFGVATIRARVFPVWTGILIIAANVIPFVLQPLGLATQIGPVALGVALVAMGSRIVTNNPEPTRAPTSTQAAPSGRI